MLPNCRRRAVHITVPNLCVAAHLAVIKLVTSCSTPVCACACACRFGGTICPAPRSSLAVKALGGNVEATVC